ncbi:ABC transporter permease [Streptomyces ovatisporus]|uniref:ABC transporter permease n=1 Tax=Streptomyces ovatisporus TaxID=1128682 RepID=A0ABV9A9Z5_9ACTN
MTTPTELDRHQPEGLGSAGAPGPHAKRRLPGPARSVLRVHRTGLLIWASFLSALAGGLVWLYFTGQQAERFDSDVCLARGHEPGVPRCADADGLSAPEFYSTLLELAQTMITYLPFAVAAYVGGALVARDFERGTAALAWTQSVTPARWLASKLAVPGLLIVGATAVLIVLQRWVWRSGPQDPVRFWWEQDAFHAGGPVGLAFAVLGLATGALAAVLTRRVLPTMGLSFAALAAAHAALGSFRDQLWPKVRVTGTEATGLTDREAEKFDAGMITESGTRAGTFCDGKQSSEALRQCLAEHDALGVFAVIHPESHFWPLQLVETGVVLALAAALTAAAFRLLRSSSGPQSTPAAGLETPA